MGNEPKKKTTAIPRNVAAGLRVLRSAEVLSKRAGKGIGVLQMAYRLNQTRGRPIAGRSIRGRRHAIAMIHEAQVTKMEDGKNVQFWHLSRYANRNLIPNGAFLLFAQLASHMAEEKYDLTEKLCDALIAVLQRVKQNAHIRQTPDDNQTKSEEFASISATVSAERQEKVSDCARTGAGVAELAQSAMDEGRPAEAWQILHLAQMLFHYWGQSTQLDPYQRHIDGVFDPVDLKELERWADAYMRQGNHN